MRTLRAVDTWPCPAVYVGAKRRLVRPPFPRGQQWLSTVLVSNRRSLIFEPVVEQLADLIRQSDHPLTITLVLDRCAGVRSVTDLDELFVRIVVIDVEGMNATDAHHRVPHQRDGDVLDARILVLLQVSEHLRGTVAIQHHVPGILIGSDRGGQDLLAQVLFHAVDRL